MADRQPRSSGHARAVVVLPIPSPVATPAPNRQRLRRRLLRASILAISISLPTWLFYESQLVGAVPVAVHVLPDGEFLVITRPVPFPTFKITARAETPPHIPVYTVNADGSLTRGVLMRNSTELPVSAVSVEHPAIVEPIGPSAYTAMRSTMVISAEQGTYPAGWSQVVLEPASISWTSSSDGSPMLIRRIRHWWRGIVRR